MADDIYYHVETELNDFYGSFATTEPADINNKNRGDTATFDLYLPVTADELIVSSGETHTVPDGQVESYAGVDNNGTLNVYGTLISHGSVNTTGGTTNVTGEIIATGNSPNAIYDYDPHAGSYTVTGTLGNTQFYREFLPDTASINSLVVGLNPATGLTEREITGVWGLISNITDSRNMALNNPMISIEVTILAEYSAFNSVSDVQTALEV